MKIVLLFIFLFCLAAFVTTLFVISPGRLKSFVDQDGRNIPGSISEKVFIEVGGVKQGMFIRGKDIRNPVMLFVHGGPAFPEYFLFEKYPVGMEDYFTICYWEQRGGGISFSSEVNMESMTIQQFASDAIEVTNYLRNRFNKDQIFMMAHCGGTAFAIKAVESSPQLFKAYIGIAQITRQADSEKLAYIYMLNRYMTYGNSEMVAEFKKFPILDNDSLILPYFGSVLRDKAMHDLGIGTMHKMRSVVKDIFLSVWTCRAYTLKEKFNIWISKFSFINKSGIRNQILTTNIPAEVPKLDIPVYFFSGSFDWTVNKDLSEEYLGTLEAPVKGFYTFNNSAHSPLFEEPQKFMEILITDVLNSSTTLADK